MKYLQTDDRDDYFESLGKNRVKKNETIYTIFENNVEIFKGESVECRQFIKKKFNLTKSLVSKGKWKDIVNANFNLTFSSYKQP